MGVRLTSQERKVALFDSVSDTAFGPVFDDEESAQSFLTWMQVHYGDPRKYNLVHLQEFYAEWIGDKLKP